MAKMKLTIWEMVKLDDIKSIERYVKHNDISNEENLFGENLLFIVQSVDVAQILIDNGVDIDKVNKFGQNALFCAKNEDIVRFLIDHKINTKLVDARGNTAIHYIRNYDSIKIIQNSK